MDTEEFSAELKKSLAKVEEHVKTLLQPDNNTLKQRIHQLEENFNRLQKMTKSEKEQHRNRSKETKAPSANNTLDHDAIFIGDSNTRDIDMSKLGYGVSRKRFTCYTIPEAMNFLNTATIVQQPKKVLLHLGTNDVVDTELEQLKNSFQELVTVTRSKFPDARIYISSIFCRMKKSDPLNNSITIMNNFIEEFCDTTARYTFIDNSNITHKNMRDPKHVNPKGFHLFIWNIRSAVFGESHYLSKQRR